MTRLWARLYEFVSWHVQEIFLFSKSSIGPGAHTATCEFVERGGAVSPCLKQPACDHERSFTSGAEIKIKWISTSIRLIYFHGAYR